MKAEWQRLKMAPHLCLQGSKVYFIVPRIIDQGPVEIGDSKRRSLFETETSEAPRQPGNTSNIKQHEKDLPWHIINLSRFL